MGYFMWIPDCGEKGLQLLMPQSVRILATERENPKLDGYFEPSWDLRLGLPSGRMPYIEMGINP
jgi:hypothetical protein